MPGIPANSVQRAIVPGTVLVGLVLAGLSAGRSRMEVLPAPVVRSSAGSSTRMTRCAECHSDVTGSFANAPHARTLHRATDPEILERFAGRSFTRQSTGVTYRYEKESEKLVLSTSSYGRPLPIEWVFGSGAHAQTPLMTLPETGSRTGSVEHAVSWYPSGKLEVTFGAEKGSDTVGLGAVGHQWGPAETAGCFGCHSAEVPMHDGRLDESRIVANLDCGRCHFDAKGHLNEIDAGRPTTIERLGSLSPLESVSRCGECHRRSEDFEGAIFPENKSIVRFAPVGLVQSACFIKQADIVFEDGKTGRMDCVTCHDPHVGSVRPRMVSISCAVCHTGEHRTAARCTSKLANDNCLPCHMPKVAMNSELEFTDHWIRKPDKP